MFWLLYIFSSIILCYWLVQLISASYRTASIIFFLTLFLTPAQIELGGSHYAPAIFIFVYNVTLELDFSFRPLRVLALTLPISLFVFISLFALKKRFF